MRWAHPAAAVAMALMSAAGAEAAGFAIREQSGSFQGLSFAGAAAGGSDISTLYFNPATLGLHDGHAAHVVSSYIRPQAEFELVAATDGSGTPTGGGAGGDIAEDVVLPALYAMTSRGDFRFGLGLTAPFGLVTDQPRSWAGRYHATDSELATVNINPVVAYRVSDRLSIGAGFVAQYADAKLARAVDFSGPAAPSPATDALSSVEGTDWDFGFTLGALAEPIAGTRIGLGYRSAVHHTLTGDFELAAAGTVLSEAQGRAALSTPDIATLGVRQRVTDAVDVLGTLEWTGWSSFERLAVSFDDPTLPPSVTEENWHDSWYGALGVEWRPQAGLALQTSVAFDQSPIDDEFRTPRIPGNDRLWLSLGALWAPRPWAEVGAAFSHIFVRDGDVALDTGPTDLGGRGTLEGRYDNQVQIFALSATLRF